MTDTHFESIKNRTAAIYTFLVMGSLMLIVFFWTWPIKQFEAPVLEEGMEVNLGNSETGLGDDQPMDPGSPAPSETVNYTPPVATANQVPEETKDIITDEKDATAPEIKKPPVTKPEATKIPEKKEPVKTKPQNKQEDIPPTPPAPKAKAVFKGATGTGQGGNEADSYTKGGNQGIAGGKGDQGKPGGDPDSKNYTGGGGNGNSGVSISKGLNGRKITGTPSFQDEFNENAKVAVDIKVDADGRVIEASYQPRGSTTSDGSMKSIAIRKAQQVKFNASGEESSGTIVFNFKVRN